MSHTITTTFEAVRASADAEWLRSRAAECHHDPADRAACPNCLAYIRVQELSSKTVGSSEPASDAAGAKGADEVLWEGGITGLTVRVLPGHHGFDSVEYFDQGGEGWQRATEPEVIWKARYFAAEARSEAARQALAGSHALAVEYATAARTLDGSKASRERLAVANGALLGAAFKENP